MTPFTFPTPDGPSLTETPGLRWGVIGTGEIAGDFTHALHAHTAQRVVAVSSRTTERGEAFSREHGVERAYDDARALAESPDIDAIYVATPHSQHLDGALTAIAAGTPVLVEKPMTLNLAQTTALADAARGAGVFAAEAMWTRYQPSFRVLSTLLADGLLGDVLLATADVGWRNDLPDPDADTPGRMFDPALGGGALLDMGVYSLWFAQFAIGPATEVEARGTAWPNGVDLDSAAVLTSASGALATATSTLRASTDGLAFIGGSKGSARFVDHFVFPGRFAVTIDGDTSVWSDPAGDAALTGRAGLAHEAVAVAAYLAEGRTESPLHSLDDSIALATTVEAVRARILGA